jgi:predicted AlkP superfamily phosphohydrolase/phosphomutase
MTGMHPGKHGLFNFIEYHPDDHSIRYTNGSYRKVHTIWRVLSDLGYRVGVVNVPMTYPPEAVNGFCISGLDTPDKDADFVYPGWLKQELEHAVGEIYLDARHLGYMNTDDKRDRLLDSLQDIATRRTDIAAHLLTHHPVDVMMLVYTATDTVQHYFWQYMTQTCSNGHATDHATYQEAIYTIYRTMDDNLAKLLRLLPADCAVMVLSDHGGGPVSNQVLHLNQYLQELGLLVYKQSARSTPRRLLQHCTSRLDDYLRGVLSPNQKSRLANLFPAVREQWEATTSALTMIDWERTKAYGLELLSFPSEIWINLAGRGPGGGVKAGAEYEQLLAFLTARLYDLRDPKTGQALIRRVYRKEDVYAGPYAANAPDLVLSWWEESAFQVRKSAPQAYHPSLRDGSGVAERTVPWNGTHRLHGILLMQGPQFRPGVRLAQAHITDIAPTLFYLLGLPIPAEMDGQVLLEAFDAHFVASHTPHYQHGMWPAPAVCTADMGFSVAETAKIRERLQGLGYID